MPEQPQGQRATRSPSDQIGPGNGGFPPGEVHLRVADGVATLTLGAPNETVISFTPERLESLAKCIVAVESQIAAGQVAGVVARSPSRSVFCAGADLKLLQRLQQGDLEFVRETLPAARDLAETERAFLAGITRERLPELGAALAERGQAVFAQLQALPVRKVAAVSGRCLGGGLELALHCDYIVAAQSDSRFAADRVATEFGFPEPLLGLLEAWGGTERTPRRIGLRRALPFLLEGKTVEPERALKMGLVDEVTPFENLYSAAEAIARGTITPRRHRLSVTDRFLTFTPLGRKLVRDGLSLPFVGQVFPGARIALAEFPREQYPAPHAILETTLHGLAHGVPAGGALAAKNFGQLMVTPTAKALVHVMFFGTEGAKARGRLAAQRLQNLTCLVAGAGQMGAGIAHALARAGHRVLVYDPVPAALAKAQRELEETIGRDRRLSSADRATMMGHLKFHQELPATLAEVDLAIEAVIERADVKRQVLAAIAERVPERAIVATNTSSLPLEQLAGAVSHPERFLGLHFFNPVRQMRLVEIVEGPHTSAAIIDFAAALVNGLGKFPVVVRDVPGFLVNRMLFPYLMEAMRLLCEGVAVTEIDRAAEKFGMRLGPLKTLDLVGFDIVRDVAHVLSTAYADRFELPSLPGLDGRPVPFAALVERFVAQGMLGKKTGAGCYVYASSKAGKKMKEMANPCFRDPAFWTAMKVRPPTPQEVPEEAITERLVLALVNEAVRLVDEGVAGANRAEAALALDLASVLGFGFAPFRGGVMYYAEQRGWPAIAAKLEQLERQLGPRFQAWQGVAQRAHTDGASH